MKHTRRFLAPRPALAAALRTGVALAVSTSTVACLAGTPRPPCDDSDPIHAVCGFRNPEDLEHVERAGVVLVTNLRFGAADDDGGFVSAYVIADGSVHRAWPADGASGGGASDPDPSLGDAQCSEPPAVDTFAPHGITARSSRDATLVFVTAHAGESGGREAVEIFGLEGTGHDARLVWKACIPTPDAIQANDVAVARDGAVVVSNFQADASLRHMIFGSLFGMDTGNVLLWESERGWREIKGTSASLPNGVAVSRDGNTIFYAESTKGLVHRVPRNGGSGAISVSIDGNPDNMTWSKRGKLLVATHTAGRAFGLCIFGRRPCKTSWAVFEIDPQTMAVKRVMQHDGVAIGAVSTALQVGDKLMLGSVFDDRIGIVEVRG